MMAFKSLSIPMIMLQEKNKTSMSKKKLTRCKTRATLTVFNAGVVIFTATKDE
jgi:hypothetical protein